MEIYVVTCNRVASKNVLAIFSRTKIAVEDNTVTCI